MKHHTRSQHVPELVYHDILNILVLPILSLASIAGLLGWLDTFYVSLTRVQGRSSLFTVVSPFSFASRPLDKCARTVVALLASDIAHGKNVRG